MEHDLAQLRSLYGVFVYKNESGDWFLKSDILNKQLSFGYNHNRFSDSSYHSIEMLYDLQGKVKGLSGLPMTLLYGGEFKIDPLLTLKCKLEAQKEILLSCSWIHRVNKNIKFVFSDEKNLTNMIHEPAKSNYNFGVMLEWAY